jgi:protein ImuB
LADVPLAVIAPIKSALRLTAVNEIAARLGLKPGMGLADARAMYPSLHAQDADPVADDKLLRSIADWCERYTPLVGLDSPGGIFLDITGCVHLFGGEKSLCQDIVSRLLQQGVTAQVAVADTVGAAWAMARYAQIAIIPRGMMRESLASLPVSFLRIDSEIVLNLAQAGLKTVNCILNRPRAALVARFGVQIARRIDQALGFEDEPIRPRRPFPSIVVEKRFLDPVGLESGILLTVESLTCELQSRLEQRGEGARRIQLILFRTDGRVMRLDVGTAAPLRDPVRIRRLFSDRLAGLVDEYDPGFGFDIIRLAVHVSERLDPEQARFANSDHTGDLAHLVDRLGSRFGLENISRIEAQNTHIPELASLTVPAHACSASQPMIGYDFAQESLIPARPIRLFERPELLSDAIAEVPDGPPVQFRWRRVLHNVSAAEGPERIAMEWWRDDSGRRLTRDYFRVQTREGARVWIYRLGLFGRETAKPNWYLHGLFA